MRLNFERPCVGAVNTFFGCGAWPSWVADIGGASGVYVIRSAGTSKRVLYVGESHTGRLKKTLLRHFQAWSGKTAGNTYSRGDVEIALIKATPARAVALQNRLIVELEPRDNKLSPDSPKNENPF